MRFGRNEKWYSDAYKSVDLREAYRTNLPSGNPKSEEISERVDLYTYYYY